MELDFIFFLFHLLWLILFVWFPFTALSYGKAHSSWLIHEIGEGATLCEGATHPHTCGKTPQKIWNQVMTAPSVFAAAWSLSFFLLFFSLVFHLCDVSYSAKGHSTRPLHMIWKLDVGLLSVMQLLFFFFSLISFLCFQSQKGSLLYRILDALWS